MTEPTSSKNNVSTSPANTGSAHSGDKAPAGHEDKGPNTQASALKITEKAVETIWEAGGHRTPAKWLAQDHHRTPSEWMDQEHHRTVDEWLSGSRSGEGTGDCILQ